MTEKILVTLGLLVFLVTGIALFMHKSGSFSPENPVMNESGSTESSAAVDQPVIGSDEESPESSGTTTSESYINADALEVVTSNLSNAALPTDADYWGVDDDLLPKFAEKLNAIFAGDENLLRETFREQMRCGRNDYRSLEDVERGIESVRTMATERMAQRGGGSPERAERMVSSMELRALEQFEDCTWRHQTAAQRLRAEVAAQAQGGDVMARYTYATMLWPSPHEENYPEEHAAWAHNALRFTEQNVMESWTLGFEAMEMSAKYGFFTPVSQAMGQAWSIVLTTCPIAGPAPVGGDWNSRFRGMTDFSNSAPIHAARLIEQHCPGSLSTFSAPDVTSVEQRGN